MDEVPDALRVVHHPRELRFRMELAAGVAELAYVPLSDSVLDLYSTWVPPEERGRRVADRLVRAALAHAREAGLRVVPSCWYVRRWMDAHPEHADLLG